jgi:hypothetical protein
MEDEKALQLFSKILSKTRSGALRWEATAEANKFIATLGGNLVLTLWPYTTFDEDGPSGPPSVTLGDGESALLLDMTSSINGISRDDLSELAARARRIALNIDKSVDAALEKLDQLSDKDQDIPF